MNVIISWVTEKQAIPNAEKAHHFVVGFNQTEGNVPLTERSITISSVPPGSYQGYIVLVDEQGVQMHTPVLFNVVVPVPEPILADVPVTVNVVLQ